MCILLVYVKWYYNARCKKPNIYKNPIKNWFIIIIIIITIIIVVLIDFVKRVHNWWHNVQGVQRADESVFKGGCCVIAIPTWKGTYGRSVDFGLSACLFCTVSTADNYKALNVISSLLLLIWNNCLMRLHGFDRLPCLFCTGSPCHLHSIQVNKNGLLYELSNETRNSGVIVSFKLSI
jgi:hypothetical protein